MRGIFSLLSVVVVLAVVGLLVKQQSRMASTESVGAGAPPSIVVNTPAQAKAVQEQVAKDMAQALQQGVQRSEPAE